MGCHIHGARGVGGCAVAIKYIRVYTLVRESCQNLYRIFKGKPSPITQKEQRGGKTSE
jgi:hypothetical protein